MEKRQAQEFINQVLNSRFDREQFELFVRNLLNEYEPKNNNYSGKLIPEAFRDHIAHYKRIGKYTDPNGEELDILIVQTSTVKKLERARTALRNFVVRHLKNFEKHYALVAFYSKEDHGAEWRLSLVKIDYALQRSEKGKIEVKEDLVPARRFSFLVGENEDAYTAQKQLLPLLLNDRSNPLIAAEKDGDGSIEGAFSVEKVTEEFYQQYKELFLKLSENQSLIRTLQKEGLDPVRFVKKLLGQIVFLYFLQKKGWLGVPKEGKMGEGSKRFLQDRFERINEKGLNYFNDFLRYLFYSALAHEHHDEGIKYYFKQLECKIPFLNGGLFEAEYDWENAELDIPNSYFRNHEKNKAGDKGTGILDVFDRYNFTIKEDEPLEKEVAVDPEMLGKVFENLLEVKDRKSKGAFYTPREIVHYMCRESLIHYLDNCLNADSGNEMIKKEDIEQLIRYGHLALEHETTVAGKGKETRAYRHKLPESVRTHAGQLDQALADIKICDPAIGSGAFPVGMLQEIVTARLVLNSFLQNNDHTPYQLKRHAIQNSIYGVDIDASAIDIARLRLWLSMIVDEEDYDTIEALPNLDYKIVCGNSLIGMPENVMRDLNVEAELEKLKEQFFDETDESKKKQLRQQINTKIRQLLDSAEQFAGYKIDFDFKLYFSEVWHQKARTERSRSGGFDVVIGNPPYVRVQYIDKHSKALFKKSFRSATGKYDLYVLFLEKGNSILNQKGNLIFINPNKFFNSDYGVGIRNYFSKNRNVNAVIDFGDTQNFSTATTYTCIIHTSNFKTESFKYHIWNSSDSDFRYISFVNRSHFELNEKWELLSESKLKIFDKLKLRGTPLLENCTEIFQGLISGGDRYFFLELLSENKNYYKVKSLLDGEIYKFEKGITKKLLKGKEAKAFKRPEINYVTIYPYKMVGNRTVLLSIQEVKSYTNVYNYLTGLKSELENRGSKNMKYVDWYAMWNNREIDKFKSPKLLTQVLSASPNFGIDKMGEYWFVGGGNAGVYGIIPKDTKNLMYYSGVLNSDLLAFYISETSTKFRGGYYSFAKRFLANFPLIIQDDFKEIIPRVTTFLYWAITDSAEYKYFLQLNNALVYELYFPEEFKSTGKEILKHLGGLKPISDKMSDEEKLAIIQSEFERLSHPDHPVKKALDTLDEVEEVRIIRETLKQ